MLPSLLLLVLSAFPQDTIVVQADGAPVWGEVELVERLRVGALSGPTEEIFGNVSSVAIGAEGTLYVLDTQVPAIRRYDATGEYLGVVGREGEGPGEYRQPMDIEALPNGGLAVWDAGTLRVSVFGPDGEHVNGFRLGTVGIFSSSDVFQVDTSGAFYIRTREGFGPVRDRRTLWLKASASGVVLDSIFLPLEDHPSAYVIPVPEGMRRPFPTEDVAAVSRCGYLVSGRTDRYRLRHPLEEGRVLEIRRSYEPVAIGSGERRQWEAYNDLFAGLAEDMGRPFTRPEIPDRKPPFRDLFLDDDCRIWVSLYGEAYEADLSAEYLAERKGRGDGVWRWREHPDWDVISPEGEFLGRVRLPDGAMLRAARGRTVVATVLGEFDETYVVVFELREL